MSTGMIVQRGSRAVRHGVQRINQTYKVKEYGRRVTSYSYAIEDDGEIPEIKTDNYYGLTPVYGDGIIGQNTVNSIARGSTLGFTALIDGYYQNIGVDTWKITNTYSFKGGTYIGELRTYNPIMGYSSPMELPWSRPFVHVVDISDDTEIVEISKTGSYVNLVYTSNGSPLYTTSNAITKFRVTFTGDSYTFYDDKGEIVPWETNNYDIESVTLTKDYSTRYGSTAVAMYQSLDVPHQYKVIETEE